MLALFGLINGMKGVHKKKKKGWNVSLGSHSW